MSYVKLIKYVKYTSPGILSIELNVCVTSVLITESNLISLLFSKSIFTFNAIICPL
jgi:hypothetical protein